MARTFALSLLGLALVASGCDMGSGNSRPNYPPRPGYYGGQPPPPGYYPQQPPPGYPQQPGQPAPGQPAPTAPGQPAALPPVAYDPINSIDLNYLRGRAQTVMQELIASLDATKQSKVNGIPLIVDDTPGDVNAFAACTQGGKAVVAITDGLLDIASQLARSKATDEVFHTNKLDPYIQFVAQNQKPNQPIVHPQAGFFDPTQDANGNKVKRQHDIFDEEIGFILGHELGHHYLGHLPCTATGGGVTAADVSHVLSSVVPIFNQPNEIAADIAGTQSVLTTGKNRAKTGNYQWTEAGGLLTMRFFAGIDSMSPIDVVFGFERTHPPPQVRTPIIQQTAAQWRSSGGQTWSIPGLPF